MEEKIKISITLSKGTVIVKLPPRSTVTELYAKVAEVSQKSEDSFRLTIKGKLLNRKEKGIQNAGLSEGDRVIMTEVKVYVRLL